jgi:hypothetical protein
MAALGHRYRPPRLLLCSPLRASLQARVFWKCHSTSAEHYVQIWVQMSENGHKIAEI